MSKAVNTNDKQRFLLWFLRNHRLRADAAYAIFEYFLTTPRRLARIHFVDDVTDCSVSLVVSTTCSPTPDFIFSHDGQETRKPKEALSYLKTHPDEEISIVLLFGQKNSSPEYSKVVKTVEYSQLPLPVESPGLEEQWVDDVIYQAQTAYLYFLIDRSLEEGDRSSFFHFVKILKRHLNHSN